MASSETGRHFTQIDSTFGSAFTSRFPVDLANQEVRTVVQKNLPNKFDDIFLSKGSIELHSTIARRGAVPLALLSARREALNSSPYDGELFDAKQFVCRALTDRRPLSVAHLSYDRSDGFITSFSLVVDGGMIGGAPQYYELRGEGESNDRVFDLTHFDGTSTKNQIQIDESIAADFVAAVNLQRGDAASLGNLDVMLTEIMDASPAVLHEQHSDNNDFNGEGLSLTITREEIITRGVAKLALYLVSMEQRGQINPITEYGISRTFTLSYDQRRSPRYQADFSVFVHDPKGTTTKSERASDYEKLSSGMRNEPKIIFHALDDAASTLAELD